MFGNYQRKTKKIMYKKIPLADFLSGINADMDPNILPLKVGTKMVNMEYAKGALTTGMGLSPLYLPHSDDPQNQFRMIDEFPYDVERAWLYRYYDPMGNDWSMIVAYCKDKYLYTCFVQSFVTTITKESRIKFSTCPTAMNYRLDGQDVLILCNKKDGMVIWDANQAGQPPKVVTNAPKISSMCVQFDKVFACLHGDKSQVWYSDDFDPTNWNVSLNEAGVLSMVDEKGRLNKVLAFKDYVYIFRDYGISRIAKTIKNTFSVQQLYQSNARIYPESVVVAGDSIIMLMEDGLYSFDGLTYKKIELPLSSLFFGANNCNAEGVFHQGKYYLACNLTFEGEENKEENGCFNTLLEYDLENGNTCLLRGVSIVSLCACHNEVFSKLLVVCKVNDKQVLAVLEKNGKVFDTPSLKTWQSAPIDFDSPNEDKYIKEICLLSKHDCKMTVTTERGKTEFSILGNDWLQTIPVKIKARTFSIAFESHTPDVYISSPTLIVGYEA